MISHRVSSSDGTEIVYHDLGGSGPTLLFAHATGFHGKVWLPIANALADSFHCYTVDMRAHGDSRASLPPGFNWQQFGRDISAVIEALGSPQPLFGVGHSKGGAALMLAEYNHPGTFAALYCFEPIVFPKAHTDVAEAAENPMAQGARKRRHVFDSRQAAYDNYAQKPPFNALDPEVLQAYVDYGFVDLADGSVELKCQGDDEAVIYGTSGTHGLFEQLGEMSVPITVARGEESHTAAAANLIVAAMPNATLEEHPEVGHFGPLEDPSRFAARIRLAFGV